MYLLEPKNISFGKDIKKIEFKPNKVIKIFKNIDGYRKTLYFLNIMKGYNHYPKILTFSEKDLKIEMENCGDLLSINKLPKNWIKQFEEIRQDFIDKQLYILDIRFMPYTPYIINNICMKNNKIYIVDLVMYRERDTNFINSNMDYLISQIKLYEKIKRIIPVLFIIHLYYEIVRLLYSIYEKIYYIDI